MKPNRATTGFLLLVVAAFFGLALVYLPPQLIAQYKRAKEAGETWAYVYAGSIAVGSAIFVISTVWILFKLWRHTRVKAKRRERRNKNPSELSQEQKHAEINENLSSVADFQEDEAVSAELRGELNPLVKDIEEKRVEQTLEIVAFGTVSSGKSSLLNLLAGRDVFQTDPKGGTTVQRNEIPWPGMDQVILVDTPGLAEIDGAEHVTISAAAAKDSDLVLVVVDGPLRESEFQLLKTLGEMEKRILVCLNKEDWYDDGEKVSLLGQISTQVQDFVRPEDVVTVRSRPTKRNRVRVLADGSEAEEAVDVEPNIEALANRMLRIVKQDGTDLLLANLLLRSRGLVEQARQRVQESLDERARSIVDKYMWGAGSLAAISPLPLVDIAAGAAVSTKMVVELARVYRQEVDLDVAVTLLGQLGKNLLSILGATAATPMVASVFASMLKAVPGIGTLAGGLLQGVVQAIVTRWIGAVFIEYFRNEMQQPEGGLTGLARRKWEQVTTVAELRKLVETARGKLTSTKDKQRDTNG